MPMFIGPEQPDGFRLYSQNAAPCPCGKGTIVSQLFMSRDGRKRHSVTLNCPNCDVSGFQIRTVQPPKGPQ